MPICEADPWRLQYFEHAVCPRDINIPTEDCDAWLWYPEHRWVYDKIAIAQSQGIEAAPHGVMPPHTYGAPSKKSLAERVIASAVRGNFTGS